MGEQLFEALQKVDPRPPQEVREIEKWPETSAGHLMTTDYVAVSPRHPRREAMEIVRKRGTRARAVRLHRLRRRPAASSSAPSASASSSSPSGERYRRGDAHNILSACRRRWIRRTSRAAWRSTTSTSSRSSPTTASFSASSRSTTSSTSSCRSKRRTSRRSAASSRSTFRTSRRPSSRSSASAPGWLIILFVEEFFTQTALRYYDPVIEAVKGALLYVPLLISAGGNSGSQSSTLVIRGLALGGDQALATGGASSSASSGWASSSGSIIAVIAMGRVHDVPGPARCLLRLTVGITVFCIIITGCTVGSMLPLVLKRFGIDPGHELDALHRQPRRHRRRHHLRARRDGRHARRHHRTPPRGAASVIGVNYSCSGDS